MRGTLAVPYPMSQSPERKRFEELPRIYRVKCYGCGAEYLCQPLEGTNCTRVMSEDDATARVVPMCPKCNAVIGQMKVSANG